MLFQRWNLSRILGKKVNFLPWKCPHLKTLNTSTNRVLLPCKLFPFTCEFDLNNPLFACEIALRNFGTKTSKKKSRRIDGNRNPEQPEPRLGVCKRKHRVKELWPLSVGSPLLWGFICMYAHVKPLHGEQARQHLCCTRTSDCVILYTSSCFLSILIS